MKSKVGIALAVMAAGAWLCAQDAPLFRRKKSPQTDDANRTPPND